MKYFKMERTLTIHIYKEKININKYKYIINK